MYYSYNDIAINLHESLKTMYIYSLQWILMAWNFSTESPGATVLNTYSYVSGCLRVI